MRLRKFEIHNFKGIESASFEWDDVVVLIGENNTGKSTILQALQCFLSGSQIKDQALFFSAASGPTHPIELVGHFDRLSDSERGAQAVRGRMHDDSWIIKKCFWCEAQEGGQESTWKEQYYSFSSEETFSGWPESESAWGNFPEEYQSLIQQLPNRASRPTNATREALRDLARQIRPNLVGRTQAAWVQNPGGGGNWKSNANSILPRCIFVKAVHDATDEAVSKEGSSYGKIVSLIVEKKLMQREEIQTLKRSIEGVLKLFSPDPDHPDRQAEEVRDVQRKINERLNDVITGFVTIRTSAPEVRPMILPSTALTLRDRLDGVETSVGYQGHGLQRTLIMTLLQILAEIQSEPAALTQAEPAREAFARSVILAIEEPELYMHPQMERKMRDTLYRLASQPGVQVICTTHSPVFLDMARRHKSIVRVAKDSNRNVTLYQVSQDMFAGPDAESERERLNLIARFHPTVNEVFFSKQVVLLEGRSELFAFERAAELTGLFERHPQLRRDVTLVDCEGKLSIPAFQRVLNHFSIPYTVVHDEDAGNAAAADLNAKIAGLLPTQNAQNKRHMISPTNIEAMLGHVGAQKDKPYRAIKRVEELHAAGGLPGNFVTALNWVYFGQENEPAAAVGD